MNLIPLYDRVLVKRDESPSISTILWTPTQRPEKVQTGIVVECGPGFRDEKGAYHQLTVKKGDKVAFLRQAGTALGGDSPDKEDLLVFREFDLLGIVPEQAVGERLSVAERNARLDEPKEKPHGEADY